MKIPTTITKTLLSLAILFGLSLPTQAQQLPQSNLYLFEFKASSDSTMRFEKPAYLTSFNPLGYNNQPYFITKDVLYFTVQLSDDTTQTDIYGVNLANNTLTQITATAESEYSPQLVPGIAQELNRKRLAPKFSCLRVEADGVTQRIWEFPLDRSTNGRPAIVDMLNVGYYSWLGQNALAVFLVGDPHQLAVVNHSSGAFRNITANIGRCLQPMPRGNLAFVHKLGRNWVIKQLDPLTNRMSLQTGTLPGSEDFVVLKDGTLLMGNGSKLYKFRKGIDNGWREVADFSEYGIDNITRMATKGNRLVLVDQ